MTHKSIRGTIRYDSHKPDRMSQERGREYFNLTQQADGVDVLLAHCEIDDSPNVVRDVSLALDHRDSSPLDCSVRISVGDQFEGTAWMRFADGYAECESYNRKDGRITQRIETKAKVAWLQAHPIVGDALLMKLYDLSNGPGSMGFENLFLSSPDHRGATGPLFFVTGFTLVYIGEERITVQAGSFDAPPLYGDGNRGQSARGAPALQCLVHR